MQRGHSTSGLVRDMPVGRIGEGGVLAPCAKFSIRDVSVGR